MLSRLGAPVGRLLVVLAFGMAGTPGTAASLLPGEALCGSECETLTLPQEMNDVGPSDDRPLWPLGLTRDAARTFLGDFVPEVPLEDTPLTDDGPDPEDQ